MNREVRYIPIFTVKQCLTIHHGLPVGKLWYFYEMKGKLDFTQAEKKVFIDTISPPLKIKPTCF